MSRLDDKINQEVLEYQNQMEQKLLQIHLDTSSTEKKLNEDLQHQTKDIEKKFIERHKEIEDTLSNVII